MPRTLRGLRLLSRAPACPPRAYITLSPHNIAIKKQFSHHSPGLLSRFSAQPTRVPVRARRSASRPGRLTYLCQRPALASGFSNSVSSDQ
jgi:hypothetical protein